jgi:hypothetical protein
MDDGGKLDYTSHNSRGLVFNTQSFTETEVNNMIANLTAKFDIPCYRKTKNGKHTIAISAKHYDRFMELSSSHIIPEMRYKLPRAGNK